MTKPQNIPSQLTLLQERSPLDLSTAISRALADDLKHPIKSRRGIADELSALLGRTITERQLENWSASSHARHRVPLDVAVALLRVTGKHGAASVALEAVGARVISGKDINYLALSKKQVQRRRLDEEIGKLEEKIR